MIETHPFQPFIPDNCKYLIIGTFPGKHSTQTNLDNDWYYTASRNQFWKIISAVYNRDIETTAEKQKLFAELGIGVTDIIYSCQRSDNTNADNNLKVEKFNPELNKILENTGIEKVFFTGKGVYHQFLENFTKSPGKKYIVLPSPSAIFRRMNLEQKIEEYKKLFPKK